MSFVPAAVTKAAAKAALSVRTNSPHILFGAGLVLGAATVVTACRATLKAPEALEQGKQHIAWARDPKHVEEFNERKEIAVAYGITARKLIVLYGPSVALGVASVACLTQSHRILTSRNAALTAAYSALDKAFKEYRKRVKDELGEDREREVFRDVREEIDSSGKKEVVKATSAGGGSGYARFFGPTNRNWADNPDYRIAFLRLQQNWANDRLRAKGVLFLNEVYEELGLERSEAGQTVGWVSGAHPEAKDGYVDFGVFSSDRADEFYRFAAGQEGVWLDFNVDGVVVDLLRRV